MVRAALLCSLLLGSLPAFAADGPPTVLAQRPEPRPRLSPEQRGRLESEVRRKLQTFVTAELAEELGLDEATAAKLSEAIRTHREAQQAARKALRDENDKLAALVRDGASDEALRAQTEKVLAAADALPGLDDLLRSTASFLTPTQQAKLVLAFPEVLRDVRGMLRGEGHGKGPKRGGPRR